MALNDVAKRTAVVPLAVFVTVTVLIAGLWTIIERQETSAVRMKAELTAEQVAVRLRDCVEARLSLLRQLRDHWLTGDADTRESFERHALVAQRNTAGVMELARIDAGGAVRWVVTDPPGETVTAPDLVRRPVVAGVLELARTTGTATITPPLELHRGGAALVAGIPLIRDGRHEGHVGAVLGVEALAQACLADAIHDNFSYAIHHDGRPFYESRAAGGRDEKHQAVQSVSVGGLTWRLTLVPATGLVAAGYTWLDEAVLGLGLLLGPGLALLTWLMVRGRTALDRSRERYRQVVEDIPALICRFEPDTKLTFVNRGYADYFEKRPEQLVGQRFLTLIPEHTHERVRQTLASLNERNPSVTYEHQVIAADGELRWQEWRDRALFDSSGSITEFQSIGVDVTEKRRAQEALRRSEERFRTIFGSVSDAIFIMDERGNMIDANTRACELHGYSRDTLLKLNLGDLSVNDPPYTRERLLQRFRRALEEPGSQLFDWKAVHGSGSPWWAEIHLKRAELGGENRILAVVRDITGRRQLEEQLRDAQKMEALGTLAGGVAHDFNNILTAIMGHTDLARARAPVDPLLARSLQGIARACDQAAGVTRSLLTFSRSNPTERSSVDLVQLITETVEMLHPILPDAVEVASDLPSDGVWIEGDRTQLQQVLINLAVNARDAMPDGGSLSIALSCRPDGEGANGPGTAWLVVEDTGSGMSEEVRVRVLEPFFTTKPRGRGTGLGLAVVHGIVARHGGRMTIHSREGRGTRIAVELPCSRLAPVAREEPSSPAAMRHGGETVLVVEDHEQVRSLIVDTLSRQGYDVLEAGDGVEAIRAFEAHGATIGLLVLDIDLPKMSGVACLHEIRRSGAGAPAILISGNPGRIDGDLPQGQVELLRKPFEMARLAELAGEMIERATIGRRSFRQP